MTDPTGRSRAKKLADELNARWKNPATLESLRRPAEAQRQQRSAKPDESEHKSGGTKSRP